MESGWWHGVLSKSNGLFISRYFFGRNIAMDAISVRVYLYLRFLVWRLSHVSLDLLENEFWKKVPCPLCLFTCFTQSLLAAFSSFWILHLHINLWWTSRAYFTKEWDVQIPSSPWLYQLVLEDYGARLSLFFTSLLGFEEARKQYIDEPASNSKVYRPDKLLKFRTCLVQIMWYRLSRERGEGRNLERKRKERGSHLCAQSNMYSIINIQLWVINKGAETFDL